MLMLLAGQLEGGMGAGQWESLVRTTGPVGAAMVLLTLCVWFLIRTGAKIMLPIIQAATPLTNNMRQITESLEISTRTAGEVQARAEVLLDKLHRMREEEKGERRQTKGILDT